MCYDITNYDSFQNLDDWYRLVVRTFPNGSMPYVAMVGNKCEIFGKRLYLIYGERKDSVFALFSCSIRVMIMLE